VAPVGSLGQAPVPGQVQVQVDEAAQLGVFHDWTSLGSKVDIDWTALIIHAWAAKDARS
jgi:hypothetical protein